ncbi:NAD-dependent epimerase/dehydratase family protein [Glaciibacter psychrotolerans]|uniref:Nucleoside-diphosphate-sugar epimerase n=1 Tax=Glaciibacter psychrotolerans TaxID=670054 RepID=A0A7Z0J6J4_9MICO|nr:NAD(P)-dependent oxidoreductase [Leifsonia psychrotolerans]NYJ20450.1 nucleoside-diphosphate-sugar epimerase [Leifsonia psychrotolerans]
MSEKILVVGGTGMIGSHIAERLAARGDQVTVMSRGSASDRDPAMIAGLPRISGDYTSAEFPTAQLDGFDSVVFSAGNDIRHVAEGDDDAEFWRTVQTEGVPAFAARVKQAGVGRFVQIGSYYHQLHPEWAATNPYVAARKGGDDGARELAGDGFVPITINPPSIVGVIPERAPRHLRKMLAWVRGELEAPELFGPKGGTNYMSVRSLAEAVEGALARGEAGRAYLVGDANLRYHEYFQLVADAAGSNRVIDERDEPHPFQPDRFIVQGRGNAIAYEPDAAETALLGYQRGDVQRAIEELVMLASK